MQSLKDLRQVTKNTGHNIIFKTIGDTCAITNKKLYAMYLNGERLSPFYTVKEWDLHKIGNTLMKNNL